MESRRSSPAVFNTTKLETMSSKQQANRHTIGSGETAYDVAQPWAAAPTGLHPRDEGPTQIVLLKILQWCRIAYRLGEERYRQRRQLMEMDDRQLKDIGITREQAEQEARKPIWKD
jgi:uncharacterized protein YjiS (DUF1127 family)